MEKITLKALERTYKNNGQHAEQVFRYTMCGKVCKADNREGADYQDIQIKSSRATVCKGHRHCKAHSTRHSTKICLYNK